LKWRYISVQPNRSNLSRRDLLATTAASVAAAGVMGAGCMEQNKKQTAKATKTLAMCGLDCAACPAFIAYRTNDQALRVKTAAEWSQQFKVRLVPEGINCVGCLKTEGVQIDHCADCEIRRCGLAKKVKDCALCPEYPSCGRIGRFIAHVPPAKANLEEVRRTQQR
jgi:stage V sporulation protein SpoVS